MKRALFLIAPALIWASAHAETIEVKPGDSLSKIAQHVFKDAGRWTEICEANKDKVKNCDKLLVGTCSIYLGPPQVAPSPQLNRR